ncbi:MAG: class II fumarate hydratase [Clostridia bacterium]|nr:class II fumarate hydratase [Clostridia bacterium]
MNYKTEHDSMGDILVPADKYWGAQTQRSFENFKIGAEKMPIEIIYAIALIKKAAAVANSELAPLKITEAKKNAIVSTCDEILAGKLDEHFPLAVWQTGSGTQTNMNVNEVITNRGNEMAGDKLLHPNDDVNLSQSSNDVFPSAIHIATLIATEQKLIPSARNLIATFKKLEKDNEGIIKTGRTHLQDATPVTFSQEISGWRSMLEKSLAMIITSLDSIRPLALGGTAVGTGALSPKGFGKLACELISKYSGTEFFESDNKFYSLSSKDALAFVHGAINAYASDLWKIANDIRLLASGPRCGIGEITIPSNEPGSSIMPGKINPTQCEAVTMTALQVQANNVAVSVAASQGNFQLNVFMPLIAYNCLQSITLMADVTESFDKNCVCGIKANISKMQENLEKSLMLVTSLSSVIGYENAAKIAKYAFENDKTLKEAALELKLLDEKTFDSVVRPENMIAGY